MDFFRACAYAACIMLYCLAALSCSKHAASASPSPSPAPEVYDPVSARGLELREKPSLEAKILSRQPRGMRLVSAGALPEKTVVDGVEGVWMNMMADEDSLLYSEPASGWVFSAWLSREGPSGAPADFGGSLTALLSDSVWVDEEYYASKGEGEASDAAPELPAYEATVEFDSFKKIYRFAADGSYSASVRGIDWKARGSWRAEGKELVLSAEEGDSEGTEKAVHRLRIAEIDCLRIAGAFEGGDGEAELVRLDNPLAEAAKAGDVEGLKAAVAAGWYADCGLHSGYSALMYAAFYGRTDAAAWLLDNGAYVWRVDQFLDTALHYAARAGQEETARLLVERGATMGHSDLGHSPADIARLSGYDSLASYLEAVPKPEAEE